MTPAHVLEQTVKQLVKVLKSPGCRSVPPQPVHHGWAMLNWCCLRICRKIPVFVESMEQAVNCASYLHSERSVTFTVAVGNTPN